MEAFTVKSSDNKMSSSGNKKPFPCTGKTSASSKMIGNMTSIFLFLRK